MATTEVELCNLALFRIRATEIGSLDEQSVNAEKCRVLYPQVRDTVLTEYNWRFNKAIKALSASLETATEWEYLFDYPNDAEKIRYLIPVDADGNASFTYESAEYDMSPIDYEILLDSNGNQVIGANYQYIKAAYSKKITDVRLWDNLVDELIAWRLAAELSIPLAGDSGKQYRDHAERKAAQYAGKAIALTANMRRPRMKQQKPRSIQTRTEGRLSRDEIIFRRGY